MTGMRQFLIVLLLVLIVYGLSRCVHEVTGHKFLSDHIEEYVDKTVDFYKKNLTKP